MIIVIIVVIVRFDAKLEMLLDASIIRTLRAKNYEHWFRGLQLIEDYVEDTFLRHGAPCFKTYPLRNLL